MEGGNTVMKKGIQDEKKDKRNKRKKRNQFKKNAYIEKKGKKKNSKISNVTSSKIQIMRLVKVPGRTVKERRRKRNSKGS